MNKYLRQLFTAVVALFVILGLSSTIIMAVRAVFNGIISLGRLGVNVTFISETGNDKVGDIILKFMRENGVSTDHVNVRSEEHTSELQSH